MLFVSIKTLVILFALVSALAATACSSAGGSESGVELSDFSAEVLGQRCYNAQSNQYNVVVRDFLKDTDAHNLRGVTMVQSEFATNLVFVAADIEGGGEDGPGPVAVWAVPSDGNGFALFEGVTSLNSAAEEFSRLSGPADEEPFPAEENGFQIAEACVLSALENKTGLFPVKLIWDPGDWVRSSLAPYPDRAALIVEVDYSRGMCKLLPFETSTASASEFQVAEWPGGAAETDSEPCGFYYQIEQPALVRESVPEEYAGLLDGKAPRPQATAVPTPTLEPRDHFPEVTMELPEPGTCFAPDSHEFTEAMAFFHWDRDNAAGPSGAFSSVRLMGSTKAPTLWFIAADVDGEGFDGPGPVAVWTITADLNDTLYFSSMMALNDAAADGSKALSILPRHRPEDPAIQMVEECVDQAINGPA